MSLAPALSADADDEQISAFRETIRARTEGTNINPNTLLTTDYLNHFSSYMMLLEILPSAPEDVAFDILIWRPATYEEHFKTSGFRDKDLAVAAYIHAPTEVRLAFDKTIDELQDIIVGNLETVRDAMENGSLQTVTQQTMKDAEKIRTLIDQAASIVNGIMPAESEETDQSEPEERVFDTQQEAIDALFDSA